MKWITARRLFVSLILNQFLTVAVSITPKTCGNGEFLCDIALKCIDGDYVCDGDNDCGDWADEISCQVPYELITPIATTINVVSCLSNQFQCVSDKICIRGEWMCDGDPDCDDRSDESITICWNRNTQLTTPNWITTNVNSNIGYTSTSVCQGPGNCSNPCRKINGTCTCEMGYHLAINNRTMLTTSLCVSNPSTDPVLAYIIAGNDDTSRMYGMDLTNHSSWLYFEEKSRTVMRDVDYDAESERIFWVDVRRETVYSYEWKTNTVYKIKTFGGLNTPIHIQWDWIAKNIYFIAHRRIKYCDSKIEFCRTLQNHEFDLIYDFVISPTARFVFWNFLIAGSGDIYRSDMDGANKKVIVSNPRKWHALTVDNIAHRIYWASEDGRSVGSSDFDGNNRRIIPVRGHFDLLTEMEIFDKYMYFSNEKQHSILRCNVDDGSCTKLLMIDSKGRIQDIKIIHKSLQPRGINHCVNSRCTELCLPTLTGYKCECSDELPANTNCKPEYVTLSSNRSVDFVNTSVSESVSSEAGKKFFFCGEIQCLHKSTCNFVDFEYICSCPFPFQGEKCENEKKISMAWLSWIGCGLSIFFLTGVVAIVLILRWRRNATTFRRAKGDHQNPTASYTAAETECQNVLVDIE